MAEEQQPDRASALAVVDKVSNKSWRVWAAKAVTTALLGGEKGAAVYAQAREHLDLIDARSAMNRFILLHQQEPRALTQILGMSVVQFDRHH
jgi:hypothetical protein